MRAITEFVMKELISNQLLIGKTFNKVYKLMNDTDLTEFSLKQDEAKTSMDALRVMWKIFEDNNQLLIEAQIKDDKYFTDEIFKKNKQEYFSAMRVLGRFRMNGPKGNNDANNQNNVQSEGNKLISEQRTRFGKLKDEIKSIHIDSIQKLNEMEDWQKTLKQRWEIIDTCHAAINEKYAGSWPDLTYDLDYLRYKNMYETTMSLFNYKIDALLYPVLYVIPHIGIPTWRMFDNASDVHPFAVNSIAWAGFARMSDLIRNNNFSEGERRQLLIRTFLSHQTSEPENIAETGEENNQQEEHVDSGDGEGENERLPLKFPIVAEID